MSNFIMQLPAGSTSVKTRYDYGESPSSDFDVFMQWVPGRVVNVATNKSAKLYRELGNNPLYLNCIKAYPTVDTKKWNLHPNERLMLEQEAEIYRPLLRGMADIPTDGDPVLLCQFGSQRYYIGPLNTANDPNFNPDISLTSNKGDNKQNIKDLFGMSPSFVWKYGSRAVGRLAGSVPSRLDMPGIDSSDPRFERDTLKDHNNGDMILEGRQGNSIRLGYHSTYPHIFISNSRGNKQDMERITDGSIISITSGGTIAQHFYEQNWNPSSTNLNKNPDRPIEWKDTSGNQILIKSGKLTFDSTYAPMTLSSYNNINIGSADNLQIYTNNSTIIESKNIYLGKTAPDDNEPMVLGTQLKETLEKMIDAIGQLFVAGTIGGTSVPVKGGGSPGWVQLETQIKTELSQILSDKHFIEKNGDK
tara:strand:- start:212 stop:1465 length:1254 start_codon:yes stop_codon:yes gene_type:complete